jgi:hypothetical protein
MSAAPDCPPEGRAVTLDNWLDGIPPVGLGELEARAALLARTERKYLLQLADVPALLGAAPGAMRVLRIEGLRSFAYASVYFDTTDLVSYRTAAHPRRRRFKVRTRAYLDSRLCWVEVKTRGPRGITVKDRRVHPFDARQALGEGSDFVDDMLVARSVAQVRSQSLAPTLLVRYRRATFLLPESASRVTVDSDLLWTDGVGARQLPGLAVVETKTTSGACAVDRLLWSRGYRPGRMSKYATCLAALRPELPATRWRRTLHRHFADARIGH